MIVEIRVPSVGESVTEGLITEWLKRPGEAVRVDEPIAILETDKVTVDILSPATGVLKEIRRRAGETATIGEVIGTVDTEGAPAGKAPPPLRPKEAPAEEVASPAGTATVRSAPAFAEGPAPQSPAVRRLLEETGANLFEIRGTGKHGRLLKEDILRHLESRPTPPAAQAEPRPLGASPSTIERAAAPSHGVVVEGARTEERVPMTPIRRRIAERLLAARQSTAMLTTFNEVDLTRVIALREQYKKHFQERYDASLGFMSFFCKATIESLKAFPALNARIDGEEIVYHNYFDLGIAVSTDRGLIVPALRNAERLSFAQTELAIADLGRRAREGKISVDELAGGTFTITNGGVFGSLLSTPILNPPQSGILGMHKIEKRPIVDANDQIVVRPMMYLALSYDHRIVDGREAVQCLVRIKECLEDPARILLEV